MPLNTLQSFLNVDRLLSFARDDSATPLDQDRLLRNVTLSFEQLFPLMETDAVDVTSMFPCYNMHARTVSDKLAVMITCSILDFGQCSDAFWSMAWDLSVNSNFLTQVIETTIRHDGGELLYATTDDNSAFGRDKDTVYDEAEYQIIMNHANIFTLTIEAPAALDTRETFLIGLYPEQVGGHKKLFIYNNHGQLSDADLLKQLSQLRADRDRRLSILQTEAPADPELN